MVYGMIMRNSKLRTALYLFVAAGMFMTIYMLRLTHYQLNDTRSQYESCQQQKDSLLAQMQVVYEQKNRVEKYLQQERQEHKQTKIEHQKSNELRILTEKDKREVETKYTELQKDHQLLEEKRQHLEAQVNQLQDTQNQKEEEKKQLQSHLDARLQDLQNNKNQEIDRLKGQINTLQAEKEKLLQQNQVQEWEFNQQVTKLQFCQSKQSELEKQLKLAHANVSHEKIPRQHILPPEVRYLPDPTKKSEPAKEAAIQQLSHDAGEGINRAAEVPETNNQALGDGKESNGGGGANISTNQPIVVANSPEAGAMPVFDYERSNTVKPVGDGGGGGGKGDNTLPTDNSFKRVSVHVPVLKMPQTERNKKVVNADTSVDEGLHNPGGLQEQIQPPNLAAAIGKKSEDEKEVDVAHLGREHIALQNLRPQIEDDSQMAGEHKNAAVENNLMKPYVGPDRPHIPQNFPVGIKRGRLFPDDHIQGHFNQLKEDNNDYVDEGDDDNVEDQDGDNDHVGNKKVQDQDFDDQENADMIDNNHGKEEGVVLIPK